MMMLSRRTLLASSLSSLAIAPYARADAAAPIRIGLLKFGTAAWEVDVIRRNGFDKAHDIAIEGVELAAAPATQVALQAGRVDMILVDWLWVANQRANGADFTFYPFSSAVGSLVAPPNSPVKTVADLAGARLGIAGSPLDKSWIILRAYARKKFNIDLDKTAQKSFGAPPLLAEEMSGGKLDAVLTFWPFAAKAEAAGMHTIMGVDDMVRELGIKATVPFVGYVFSSAWARRSDVALAGFLAAAREAHELLATSDAEWQALKPITGAASDAELEQLKKAYRRGFVRDWGAPEKEAAEQLFGILAEVGGPALVGPSSTIPPGTFW